MVELDTLQAIVLVWCKTTVIFAKASWTLQRLASHQKDLSDHYEHMYWHYGGRKMIYSVSYKVWHLDHLDMISAYEITQK